MSSLAAKGLRYCHNPLGFEIVFHVFGDKADEMEGGASLAGQTTSAHFRGEHKASLHFVTFTMNSLIQDVKRVRG